MIKEHLKKGNKVQLVANAGVREVNWERDAPGRVPAAVKDRLLAVSMEHTDVRKQLDILRQTRSQRQLEPLKVPVHLQQGIPMSDAGVQKRIMLPPGSSE